MSANVLSTVEEADLVLVSLAISQGSREFATGIVAR